MAVWNEIHTQKSLLTFSSSVMKRLNQRYDAPFEIKEKLEMGYPNE